VAYARVAGRSGGGKWWEQMAPVLLTHRRQVGQLGASGGEVHLSSDMLASSFAVNPADECGAAEPI
jgi:hypothetical protein